jgi:hypothetical protein
MSKYSRRRPAGLKIGDTVKVFDFIKMMGPEYDTKKSAQEITEIMRCFAPGFGYAEE